MGCVWERLKDLLLTQVFQSRGTSEDPVAAEEDKTLGCETGWRAYELGSLQGLDEQPGCGKGPRG